MEFELRRSPQAGQTRWTLVTAFVPVGVALLACTPAGGPASGSGGAGMASGGAPGTGGLTATGGRPPGSGGAVGTGGVGATGGVRGDLDAGSDGPAAPGDAATEHGADAVPRDAAAERAPASDGGAGGAAGWRLVWSDEFDVDGAPQAANWRHEAGFVRNMELQWYQAANARVENGVLLIEGKRETVANPNYQAGSSDWKRSRQSAQYTSSSITTSGKHTFTYGRFEARARIDVRTGSWPAFWTVGAMGGWPAGGEIDIMEFYAGKVLANVCKPSGSTCAWSSVTKNVSTLGADWPNQFHEWAMEWDAQKIDLYLDGVLMNHFAVADAVPAGTTNPYVARPVYIILNLALGANGGDPAGTTFPIKYEVDYVRVYQR